MKRLWVLGLLGSALPGFAMPAEYHWTICDAPATVRRQLGADVTETSHRYLYYLDTVERTLFRGGLILRARGDARSPVEITVKFKAQPSSIPPAFKKEPGFKCEADYVGQKAVSHCSFTEEKAKLSDLKLFLKGQVGPEVLFSKQQLRYLGAMGVRVPWDHVKPYGPIDNLKWKLKVSRSDLDMEYFTAASGSTFLGLSRRVKEESTSEYQQWGALLVSRGVRLCPKQVGAASWALGANLLQ